jgi:hypothetical protein
MPILSLRQCSFVLVLLSFSLASQADDLHFKKTISVGGTTVSSSEVWVKGARERSVTNSPTGTTVMLRQCDLKRSVTLNEKSQAYMATGDIQDEEAMKAAALLGGGQAAPSVGGTITQTTTIADTGERKPMLGFTARHLKMTVQVDSSANTCTQVSQKYEIDGWYADVTKDQASCQAFLPPIHQNDGCNDRVIARHSGTGKPGYPLVETITLHNADSTTTKIDVATIAMPKQVLTADKFDVPTGYHQVNSIAELNNAAPVQSAASYSAMPAQQMAQGNGAASQASQFGNMGGAGGMMAQAQQMGAGQMGMGQSGMPTGAPIALPQTLGPKAPGRIRIGIAPAQAQLGQGNDAQNDYGTPVRNSIIFLMSGPSIEIAALDSRIPMQVQSEAQQKQCDYILMSGVTITHGATSGFGKFMKAGNMAASMTPVGMMAHTAGAMATAQAAAAAAQAASQAAAMQTVQQKAMSQLAGLNGQVKSKDDVTVEYHLYPTGQDKAVLDNVLKGKAKHDGEDVLTPLMQQAANSVLTQVTKK